MPNNPHPPFDAKRNEVYVKNSDVVSRDIVDETILVPIKGNLAELQCIFSLESVGAFLWDQLDGKNSMGDMLALVLDEFDVEPEQARADLDQFLAQLNEAGLISRVIC